MKEDFDSLKGLDVVEFRRCKRYCVSAIITFFLLLGVIIATFIYFVLPMHKPLLTICFIGGMVAGVFNIVMEFRPEIHYHISCKVPQDKDIWKPLYLISTCIEYDPEENIITFQFMQELEPMVHEFVMLHKDDKAR